MRMELVDQPVMMFRDMDSCVLNVVYRRSDENIGWINPETRSRERGSWGCRGPASVSFVTFEFCIPFNTDSEFFEGRTILTPRARSR